MIIKKFQGKTEEAATALAREEMGNNVVIMNARQIKRKGIMGIFGKPIYEVTAAIEEESERKQAKEEKPAPAKEEKPEFPGVILDEPVSKNETAEKDRNIEAQLENLSSLIEQKILNENLAPSKNDDEIITEKKDDVVVFLKLIYNTLIGNEVDEHYVNDLFDELDSTNRRGTMVEAILPDIYQKLILKFGESEEITKAEEGAKVIFFMGPTGVGKTTTVAKLASKLSVMQGKKVAMLTTDTYRIAATEQLKTYASILEIPFRIIYTADELLNAYEEYSDYDFILVDTAGHSPNNEQQFLGTKEFVGALEGKCEIDKFLVLSVTTKYKDLIKISDLYSTISKYKLIFTKLDETDCYGSILNIKLHTGAPMSYVTMGQNVPDDLEVFKAQSVVKGLLQN